MDRGPDSYDHDACTADMGAVRRAKTRDAADERRLVKVAGKGLGKRRGTFSGRNGRGTNGRGGGGRVRRDLPLASLPPATNKGEGSLYDGRPTPRQPFDFF